VPCDQSFPGRIDGRHLGQQDENVFDPLQFRSSLLRRQSEAVLFKGAGRHNPEFNKDLRNDMEFPAARGQSLYCRADDFKLRMTWL
jgi:hypothetical protein